MSPTGDLLVTSIFLWGGAHSSLLSGPRVLRWHSTSLVAAHPSRVTISRHVWLRKGSAALLVKLAFPLVHLSGSKPNVVTSWLSVASEFHGLPSGLCPNCSQCLFLCVISLLPSLAPFTVPGKTSLYIKLQQWVEEDGACKHPCGRGNSTISDA